MKYTVTDHPSLHTCARLSSFVPDEGVAEYHLMITVTDPRIGFAAQLSGVLETFVATLNTLPSGTRAVFKRWFLSDAANQASHLPQNDACAVSVVEQPPLNGSKVALWVYLQQDVAVAPISGTGIYEVSHGVCRHLWRGSAAVPDLHSEIATMALLEDLSLSLESSGGSLAGNCVRTWFFVHDVDVNYLGVVNGRNKSFAVAGLTPDTHFISSTGIGGRHADPRVTVQMDSYSIIGLADGQMSYLYATEYLNPTYEYGVAFERGTRVDYGDRRHLLISGTASIDNRGEVVHPGDIRRQTLRMLTNVEALLAEGGCSWSDVGHMIVYLRDPADHCVVSDMLAERFPHMPMVIVLAPVCRPGWLIEMECMAVNAAGNHIYAPF